MYLTTCPSTTSTRLFHLIMVTEQLQISEQAFQPELRDVHRPNVCRAGPDPRCARPAACSRLPLMLTSACLLAEQLNDPRVKQIFDAKEPIGLRVRSSFFATTGWVPDADYYTGDFNPATDWVAKRRAELRVMFDGDQTKTKVKLADMLAHGLTIYNKTQQYDPSDSSDPPSPASANNSEDMPIADLVPGVSPDGSSTVGSNISSPADPFSSSGSSWPGSPLGLDRHGRRTRSPPSSTTSSPLSPLAEQQQQQPAAAPAAASPAAAPPPLEPDSSDDEAEALAAERVDYGTKYTKRSADKTQPAKTVEWMLIDHSKVKVDERHGASHGIYGTDYGAVLLNTNGDIDTVYKMWKHFVPTEWLPRLAATANDHLEDDPTDKNYRKTCSAEMECVLGLALAASINGSGPFDSFFSTAIDDDAFFQGAGFGKYGVSKNRAKVLLRFSHLSYGPQAPAGKDPVHWFIDEPCKEYNEHMAKSIRPSFLATMDESGPPWHGAEKEGNYYACPHITVVKRKPEPVCAEFNDAGDSITGVLMYLEYEKAAKYHKDLKYMKEVGTYNAAMALRCTEPWKNSNALIYGDSRFGSVKAAVAIKEIHGVQSAWDVKTGTALYPRKELVRMCGKEHGAVVVMSAEVKGVKLYAIGQRRGPSVHTFLSTCGTFIPEIPARFHRLLSVEHAPWTTPSILNTVTRAQPMIDKFNRTVFDQLGAHDTFITRCFETRFSHGFMLPITYVSAANAALHFSSTRYKHILPKRILLELAMNMAKNTQWLSKLNPPRQGPGGSGGTRSGVNYAAPSTSSGPRVSINGGPPSRESPAKHVLIPLAQLEGYKGAKQMRCYECNELCSWACARCSDVRSGIIALHPPVAQGSKRKYGCLGSHRCNPAGGGYKAFCERVTGCAKSAKRRRKLPFQVVDDFE